MSCKCTFNLVFAVFLSLIATPSLLEASQNGFCRADIVPTDNKKIGYRDRGDRCEGLFVQKVSATGLRIAAFHNHPAIYKKDSLHIGVYSKAVETSKELTVTSIKSRQHYRMDTVFSGDAYDLPLDVLQHPLIDVKPADVSAVVCTDNCQSTLPTLVPASFAKDKERNPYVTFIANLQLHELRVTIKDKGTDEILFSQEMLGNRSWAAGRPANFPLKSYLEKSKKLLLEVVAVGRGNKLVDSLIVVLDIN